MGLVNSGFVEVGLDPSCILTLNLNFINIRQIWVGPQFGWPNETRTYILYDVREYMERWYLKCNLDCPKHQLKGNSVYYHLGHVWHRKIGWRKDFLFHPTSVSFVRTEHFSKSKSLSTREISPHLQLRILSSLRGNATFSTQYPNKGQGISPKFFWSNQTKDKIVHECV